MLALLSALLLGSTAVCAEAPAYRHYRVDGELEFELPKSWRISNAWKDEVPTLYAELPAGREGKPVTIVVSKIAVGQADFADIEKAIKKEKQWTRAREGGRGKVGGLPARFTYVPRESRTAYVENDAGSYYTFIYSAPPSLYDLHKPAFERLLKSFKLVEAEGDDS